MEERADVTAEMFNNDILPAGKPVVMRRIVADWPVVRVGRESPQALADYLKRFETNKPLGTMYGKPEINGRFFYNEDLSGFNFRNGPARLTDSLDYMLTQLGEEPPHSLFVQSVPTRYGLPGFEEQNPAPFIGKIEPRVWIGNKIIVGAHHDPAENIACCVAGRRRFTVFPIEQVSNLYLGPFEQTPAGTTVSLVDFDAPDYERFPRFKAALETALVADLEPGDGVYIPYLWWHHVRSLERMNMLVNYWWDSLVQGRGHPRAAFFHAIVSIRQLPKAHRLAWRTMFEHYAFNENDDAATHLPENKRGLLSDEYDAEFQKYVRDALRRMTEN
ncbi:MAG: cupin-like domain-containing protein [Pseudomonadota bacterium]